MRLRIRSVTDEPQVHDIIRETKTKDLTPCTQSGKLKVTYMRINGHCIGSGTICLHAGVFVPELTRPPRDTAAAWVGTTHRILWESNQPT